MADQHIKVDDLDGNLWAVKIRDLSDGNYALSAVEEGILSADVSCSSYSNANLGTLITSVNSYLSGSSKRLKSIEWFAWGTVTATYYAIVTEIG